MGALELGEGRDFLRLAMTICYKGLGKEKAYTSVLHKTDKSCYICMIPCIFLREEQKYIVVYIEWTYVEKQEAVGADIQYCGLFLISPPPPFLVDAFFI